MTPPRGSQDASRTPQDGFCLRFGRQLGAILGIFFRPRRPPGPQDASKRPSWECLGTSWGRVGAFWRPRPTRSEGDQFFGGLLKPSWPHFWEVFGYFLGWNFNTFLTLSLNTSTCRKAKKYPFCNTGEPFEALHVH